MKYLKIFTCFALVLVILFCYAISAFAIEQVGNTYDIGDKTIIFEAGSSFTVEQQQIIARQLADPEYGVAPANLMCGLFGHKTTGETVIALTHKAKATAPRCLEEYYALTACSRCDYQNVERTGFMYISCCPED